MSQTVFTLREERAKMKKNLMTYVEEKLRDQLQLFTMIFSSSSSWLIVATIALPSASSKYTPSQPLSTPACHQEESFTHPNRSTHHESERPSHTANTISTHCRGILKIIIDEQHMRSLPEEIQRVLKAIPPSPQ